MPRVYPGDVHGAEDVPFWPLARDANLAAQFGIPGAIDLVAGSIQPVAIVGDIRGQQSDQAAEIFTASAWVAANAGDAGLFEFHHPREPTPFALGAFISALFEVATGNTVNAVKTLIQGEPSKVSRLVVVRDVVLSYTSITNALGAWGGAQWINPGFGSAPVIIDVLATNIQPGSSYAGATSTKHRARLWAGRRADSSALPLQNNAGAVFGSPGSLTMLSSSTGSQGWRPFGRATPFVMLPGRGFAIGFGASGAGTQTNVQAACSVVWEEVNVGDGS